MSDNYLGIQSKKLVEYGGYNTAKEIESQPRLWVSTILKIKSESAEIKKFLDPIFEQKDLTIIFTGAGSSAFIGNVLEAPFQFNTGIQCKSIPTTTLVTHPEYYILKDKPTLLISFARSGDSPESIKTIEVVNKVSQNVYHLIISCNPDGQISKIFDDGRVFHFTLPEGTNDKSLVMTSSFTSMLLAGLVISRLDDLTKDIEAVSILSRVGKEFINTNYSKIEEIAEMDFERAVFLGSGYFEGIAQESHLKLQELTDGEVICKFDSFLGFRHGPKAVLNKRTLVIGFFSRNKYANKYENDLIETINSGKNVLHLAGVMVSKSNTLKNKNIDTSIIINEDALLIPEEYLSVLYVLTAQILGFYKAIQFDLQPDNPSKRGEISRVVQGVKLYPYTNEALEV